MRRAVLLTLLLLTACGQSGDLYLPSDAPPPGAQPAPTPDKDETKKDER